MKLNHAVFFRDLYNLWPFKSSYDLRFQHIFMSAQGIRNGAKQSCTGLYFDCKDRKEHIAAGGMHFNRQHREYGDKEILERNNFQK
jgi:hypothetical protein